MSYLDNSCRSGEECVSQDNCPGFLDLKEQFKSATKGTDEWKSMLITLRGKVCQKKSSLVCCAIPTTTTTTTTTTTRTTSIEDFDCPEQQCIPVKNCKSVEEDYKNVKSSDGAVKVAFYTNPYLFIRESF